MQVPRFLISKDIKQRGIVRLDTINTEFNNIHRVFGSPCLSEAAGDIFDGPESVAWIIKFEDGLIAEISDVSMFGDDKNYKKCTSWHVFGHSPRVVEYIKAYLKI